MPSSAARTSFFNSLADLNSTIRATRSLTRNVRTKLRNFSSSIVKRLPQTLISPLLASYSAARPFRRSETRKAAATL